MSSPESSPEWNDRLAALYADLASDIAAAGPVCDLSGRCCRFAEYGHMLFISRPEAELLLQDGLPEGAVVNEDSCPFQIGGLCSARERRPLGCRVYYCDPGYAETGSALSERYISRLKELHEATGAAWDYRPLHGYLREATPPGSPSDQQSHRSPEAA